MELVSVIIPTHFRPDRVVNALESVRHQTWDNLEIIVVSDGYDEETEKAVEAQKKEDNRISLFSYKESKGGNFARNTGVKNASADYIAFLDDDDIWYPTKIEKQMDLMKRNPKIGIVGCGINVKHIDWGIEYKSIFSKPKDASKEILYTNFLGSTSCVLVKKEALERCGYFDESLPARQDHDLWIRICQDYEVDFVDSVQLDYYVYNSTGKSQQTSKSIKKYITAHEIISDKYKYLYEQLSSDEQVALKAKRVLGIAQRAAETGKIKIAYKYALESWKIKKSKKALFYCIFSFVPYKMLVKIRALKG